MKRSILLSLLTLTVLLAIVSLHSPVAAHGDELYLKVILVTGESSRDSNSTTRTLTVSADSLTYQETYQGAGASRRTPVKKQFKLTDQDRTDLIGLLKAKALLTDSTLSKPPTKDTNRYFQISITSTLNGREHQVSIEATPTSNLKDEPVYQNAISLIARLYSIINKTDPEIRIPTFTD